MENVRKSLSIKKDLDKIIADLSKKEKRSWNSMAVILFTEAIDTRKKKKVK